MLQTPTLTPRPYSLLAEITYLCPLKCPYCSNPLHMGRYREELDTETWKRVMGEAAELGVAQMHFSGGEPMARRDLAEMLSAARELDLYTHLSTGATLATEAKLTELREAGLDAIQISLLDSQPDKNDWLAGAKCFDAKREAVAISQRLGMPVTLNIVFHRHNLERIGEAMELAEEWGVNRLELAHTQYTGWAFKNRAALMPSADQIDRAYDLVEAARERLEQKMEVVHVKPDYYDDRPKACLHGWGQVFMTVAPDGAVLPCQTAREIPDLDFPNVRDASLEEIWFRSPVFNRFRGTDWMPEPCRTCDQREIDFGGCRCQAFLITGDAANTDPVCGLSPQHALVSQAVEEARALDEPFDYRVLRP